MTTQRKQRPLQIKLLTCADLLKRNTIKNYYGTQLIRNIKKQIQKIKDEINKKGKEILKNKEALHRLDINEESNCFFTLNNHKENFQNNSTVRLFNPAKDEIGKIILDKINTTVKG